MPSLDWRNASYPLPWKQPVPPGDTCHRSSKAKRLSIFTRDGTRPPAILGALTEGRCAMLWTIFVILLVLWLLGMVSSYTLGGFIHILLVLAIVVVLIRVIQGRRPV
jgi:hypothetical protein